MLDVLSAYEYDDLEASRFSTRYPVTGDPPLFSGSFHSTQTESADIALVTRGALGGPGTPVIIQYLSYLYRLQSV